MSTINILRSITILITEYFRTPQLLASMKRILIAIFCIPLVLCLCNHDRLMREHPIHFTDDLAAGRRLQAQTISKRPFKIFYDETGLVNGNPMILNAIKRSLNIITNFLSLLIKVESTGNIRFPADKNVCGTTKVDEKYKKSDTNADLGVFAKSTTEQGKSAFYAQALACVAVKSKGRPYWGEITFNATLIQISLNAGLPNSLDQLNFQKLLFSTLHEFMHIIGFSQSLYDNFNVEGKAYENKIIFPTDNVTNPYNQIYLTTKKIKDEIKSHFNCSTSNGLETEDSSNSHWERHHLGNELMVATNTKNTYISRFSLALLDSTGWYQEINYDLAEPMEWGKGKGCKFLDSAECDFDEFCQGQRPGCDWDGTGIGGCRNDILLDRCSIYQELLNQRCIDPTLTQRSTRGNNLLYSYEKGGYSSRCFTSSFRINGLEETGINNRCYETICLSNAQGPIMLVLIDKFVFVCSKPSQQFPSLPGFAGDLYCPSDIPKICAMKKTCINNCNSNGICNNGKCLCFGSNKLTFFCAKPQDQDLVPPKASRLLQADSIPRGLRRCQNGFVFDPITQQCVPCLDLLGCRECDDRGCLGAGQKS